jgi:hypothetical protein
MTLVSELAKNENQTTLAYTIDRHTLVSTNYQLESKDFLATQKKVYFPSNNKLVMPYIRRAINECPILNIILCILTCGHISTRKKALVPKFQLLSATFSLIKKIQNGNVVYLLIFSLDESSRFSPQLCSLQ